MNKILFVSKIGLKITKKNIIGLKTRENLMAVVNLIGEVLISAITNDVKRIVLVRLYLFKLIREIKKKINTIIFAKGEILFKKELASERVSNLIKILSLSSKVANSSFTQLINYISD